MSSVAVTLSSSYGYFSVSSPTVSLGTLPAGNKTATWEITDISDGTDYIVISATARNPHQSYFTDSYRPYPMIMVGNATEIPSPTPYAYPTPSPTPTPTSTPTPTTSPTPPHSPAPTAMPTLAPTLTPTPTSTPVPSPRPTQNATLSPMPTESPELPVLSMEAIALVAVVMGTVIYILKTEKTGKRTQKRHITKMSSYALQKERNRVLNK